MGKTKHAITGFAKLAHSPTYSLPVEFNLQNSVLGVAWEIAPSGCQSRGSEEGVFAALLSSSSFLYLSATVKSAIPRDFQAHRE